MVESGAITRSTVFLMTMTSDLVLRLNSLAKTIDSGSPCMESSKTQLSTKFNRPFSFHVWADLHPRLSVAGYGN